MSKFAVRNNVGDMRNDVKTTPLTAEMTGKIARLADSIRHHKVTDSKEIGEAAKQRLDDVRRQWAECLKGIKRADMTVTSVDDLHTNQLVRLAKTILLPEADSMCAFLHETKETGVSTVFMANVREFKHLAPEQNKYLIIECNKLGADVRKIFEDSMFQLIK